MGGCKDQEGESGREALEIFRERVERAEREGEGKRRRRKEKERKKVGEAEKEKRGDGGVEA